MSSVTDLADDVMFSASGSSPVIPEGSRVLLRFTVDTDVELALESDSKTELKFD